MTPVVVEAIGGFRLLVSDFNSFVINRTASAGSCLLFFVLYCFVLLCCWFALVIICMFFHVGLIYTTINMRTPRTYNSCISHITQSGLIQTVVNTFCCGLAQEVELGRVDSQPEGC